MGRNWNYEQLKKTLEKKGTFIREKILQDLVLAAKDPQEKILIILLITSGRRIGEILRIKVNDFDYNDNTIGYYINKKTRVKEYLKILKAENFKAWKETKDNKYVIIPASAKPYKKKLLLNFSNFKTKDLIQNYIDKKSLTENECIFKSNHGDNQPLGNRWAERKIKDLCEKIGLHKNNPDDLELIKTIIPRNFRHTCAKLMAKAGYSESFIKSQLDHSSIAITELYTEADPEMMKEIVKTRPLKINMKEEGDE
jgi:integrase